MRLISKYQLGGYTIQPGDTLSSIAQKYNLNYKDIAAINGIADPNLINAGDKISLDTPSNTKDNLNGIKGRYINNYQDLHTGVKSKYDYFLGNNGELFYKLKGADKWIDISNNEKAKTNLNNFIKNYSIGAKPQKPKSSFQNKIDQKRQLIKSPEIVIEDFEYNGVKSKNDYKLVRNKTYKRVKGTQNWIDISNDIQSRKNLETFINSKQSKQDNKQNKQYNYFPINYLPGPYNPYQSIPVKSQENQRIIPVSQYDSAIMSEAFENLFTKGLSYFNRHYRNEEHSIVPEIQTGKYKINYNGYSKPAVSIKHKSADKFNSTLQAVDYDPNTFIFGTRNRGEYPNDADNVTLTTFNPFVDKDNPVLKKYHSFIGISSDGKLKVSTDLNDFVGEGWKISPTYSNIITGFRRNEDGSLYLDKDYLKGTKTPDNPKHRIVWFNGIDDNGNAFNNGQLNVLTPVQDKNGKFSTNYYGDIAGGKALFATDDGQMRLLSGSIEQIVAGFEEFQRSNPGKQIRMYTLDNGAYSKLLKKNQGYFSKEDWNKYDNQHFGGGNVAYIKGNAAQQLQFPSDTAYTLINNPSYTGIAKPNDAQVKKGHPITREPQGIVLHQTATRMSAPNSEVLRAFQQNGTGANVVIGTRGQRTVLASPDRVTYHAGYSAYQDENKLLENLNDYFSGIEFVGEKRDLITDAQVQSAIEYLRPIIQQYKIYPNKLVTHEQVRNAYNKLHNNSAPNKWDMNYKSYEKLMKAILNEIYYQKHGGKLIKRYEKIDQ